MSRCEACGAAIVWATTFAAGEPSPFDADPHELGEYLLEQHDAGVVAVHVPAPPAEQLTLVGMPDRRPRHRSHFATCPHADDFRDVA